MRTLMLRFLFTRPVTLDGPGAGDEAVRALKGTLDDLSRRVLGRSLSVRQVDAGSCNGCELEIHALNNSVYDLERFGLKFVASPRHADVLLVTGPLTRNMKVALERAWNATPDPKWVVALGDCAATGGMFADSYACVGPIEKAIPVDLRIPGCPPRPIEILQGLVALMDAASRTGSAAPIGRPVPKAPEE
jgi:Ni,Fe-hydrogenase III small subunit